MIYSLTYYLKSPLQKVVSFKSLTYIRSLTFCSLEIFRNIEVSNNNIRICLKRVQRQSNSTCSVLLQG